MLSLQHKGGSRHETIKRAYDLAEPGDVVLLAPACASLDEFKSFEARGDIFAAKVMEL